MKWPLFYGIGLNCPIGSQNVHRQTILDECHFGRYVLKVKFFSSEVPVKIKSSIRLEEGNDRKIIAD